jgi:hypothetical protein
MFKKLIERIDAINDYVNPIVVRDMRSEFGGKQPVNVTKTIMAYSCFLILGCLLIYFLYDLDSLALSFNKFMVRFALQKLVGFVLLLSVLCIAASILAGWSYFIRHLTDEMFLITAITPHQYLHAYMLETFILTSLCVSLVAPVILIVFGQVLNCLALVTIVSCGSVLCILFAQAGILIIISFSVRTKRPDQTGNIGCSVYVGVLIFLLPWFLLAFVANYLGWHAIYDANNIFGFVSIYVLLPIGFLLTGAMGYKLSFYGFKTQRKSLLRMFFLNIFCYTLLSVVMALIYFCIAFVVFNFL